MRAKLPKLFTVHLGIVAVGVAFAAINLALPLRGAALPAAQSQIYAEGIMYYDVVAGSSCNALAAGGSSATADPSAVQAANAQIVIGIAKTDNLGQAGALIGLMVALDESSLTNLANQNVPLSEQNPQKQGDGNNGTSLGVFQQQITTDWSTISSSISDAAAINQLMTPAYAAEAFFGTTDPSAAPALRKGLVNHSGWQSMDPWVAAQAVQASGTADGSNYRAQLGAAKSLLTKYYDSSPAVALPIPATTSSQTAAGTTADDCSADSASTQAVIQAGLAEIAKNIPYTFGGGGQNGPSGTPAGFDCSSFMQYIFYQGANITLPRTAQDQYNATVGAGHSVETNNIQAGDLLFYGSDPGNIQHVAMYVGDGNIIEAPYTGANLHDIPQYIEAAPGETLQGIGFFPPIGG